MDRPEGSGSASASAVGDIPEGPLVEILSRVPGKSVCRFECVSKAWLGLIADNRKKLRQAMQGLFYRTLEYPEGYDITAFELYDLEYIYSFIDLTTRSVPLDIDPGFSFLTELPEIQCLVSRNSCNGLILFENRHKIYSLPQSTLGYIVCNPTTKQWVAVPTCGSTASFTYTYLAFDPAVSSHFHLVHFKVGSNDRLVSVNIYSSETGTWSRNQIDEQEELGQSEGWRDYQVRLCMSGGVGTEGSRCAFVNGFLHLVVWDSGQPKVLAVDLQGKARRMITLPQVAYSPGCYLGQSQGLLHYTTQGFSDAHQERYQLRIWVLQDYDTQEWVLKDTLELSGENCIGNMWGFFVFNIHQDCNVVFFTKSGRELMSYDMCRKEVSVIATFEGRNHLTDAFQYVPYFSKLPALTNNH
ncbi:hypothetical protein SETIT_2G064400v2 [Setaria italica]|uniref:Uncharacterized protein n=1 Tax=Setaria italica TaxID=4555 RepID=K3ZTR6_SETIT|nr:putative F-box protein At1g19160 [Setaria italica]RCV09872.1 hypothetical protein SETIT_2G064400v2 [Setaria italica]